MDEAERRFRACTNRFKRDLTRIISRSIDGMVREARKASAKQAAHDAKLEKQALAQAKRDERVARKAAEKQARVEAREAKRKAAQDAKAQRAAERAAARVNGAGQQLELQLDLAAVRPAKVGRGRVRADSILGAELANGALAGAGDRSTAATLPSPGAAPRQPSERPLFVHKRARDGQIHALRRGVRENAAPAPPEAKPDAESRERP
ncbi:MAG TPA: hypothetical protein VI197_11975 [Polyangiaceae bacterium]